MAIADSQTDDELQATTDDVDAEIEASVKMGSRIRFVVRQFTADDDPLRQTVENHGHGDPVGLTAADLQRLVAIVDPVTFTGSVAQTQRHRIIMAARDAGVIPE